MDFFDILKDTFVKGESGQDVTVNELVEEIKEKLSGIIEQPDSIRSEDTSSWVCSLNGRWSSSFFLADV
ncbi:hypothetical protein [Peribacillus frigoritolerans]|uniref:hypothetical protein n=1 Tax=Peribacillus frigoritolerans TaxID=450367 RepID=UPI002B05941F|nr:hypothetical protein [Peribacillus frigoritolerans]MEA3573911.1 hypothetical protein [Peribacillus frigoritolerans]